MGTAFQARDGFVAVYPIGPGQLRQKCLAKHTKSFAITRYLISTQVQNCELYHIRFVQRNGAEVW